MDIKDYFSILWRRKWIFLVTVMAALAVAIVGTNLVTPVYEASTTVRVAAAAGGPLNFTASTYSNQLINTAAQIVASAPMRDQVVARLNLKAQPIVTATVIPDTELIKITVQDSNPKVAVQIANTLADMLVARSNELYTGGTVSSQDILAQQLTEYKASLDQSQKEYDAILAKTPAAPDEAAAARDILVVKQGRYETLLLDYNDAVLQEQVRSSMMTVVEQAVPPTSPLEPQRTNNILIGLAVGLFVGVVLAFLVESMDPTLQSAKDVESAAGLPILARIPKSAKNKVRMSANDPSPLAESFRNLALGIMLAHREPAGKVLLILSAQSQQGKSTVAANLTTALAEYGKNVVAVDCDMRRPKLHELFGLPNETGLRNILQGDSDLKTELRHPADCVNVLTSGELPINPSQLLNSPKMAKLLRELRTQFDFVVMDTPAWLDVSDVSAIAQNMQLVENVDEYLLVVRQGHAEREPVRMAGKLIEQLPHQAAGVVLNQAEGTVSNYYYRPAKAKVEA